ncbi:MAG: hypothetical protein M3R27_14565 [Bacteroidota bacterium]|nr:hypothetical protein [Bacteroidota bacterium]
MKENETTKHVIVDLDTAERLKRIEANCADISEIKKLLLGKQENSAPLGDWITEQRAIELSQKKKTTLYKLRMAGELVYSGTRPIFYSLASIKSYLENHKK